MSKGRSFASRDLRASAPRDLRGLRGRWLMLVVTAGLLAGTSISAADAVLMEDFDQRRKSDFYKRLTEHDRLELGTRAGVNGTNAIRASYVGTSDGSERIIVTAPLARSATECTLCFDVQLEEGFKYVQGGRMHGVGPDNRVVGQRPDDPEAWCARIRFRSDGTLETSTSHQDQQRREGDRGNRIRPYRLLPGRYYAISLHVRLNDPGESNGVVKLYVNGILVEERTEVRFRRTGGPDSEISHAMFNTFYGGHSRADAPRNLDGSFTVCKALYDNFAVYEGEQIRKSPGE